MQKLFFIPFAICFFLSAVFFALVFYPGLAALSPALKAVGFLVNLACAAFIAVASLDMYLAFRRKD